VKPRPQPIRLVKTVTADGLELDGIISLPAYSVPDVCIVHMHGKCGNFYQNPFIATMLTLYPLFNIAFASFNNRGHDCVAEGYREGRVEYIGGSLEYPAHCLLDIDAIVEAARQETGARHLVLQGHSMGCEKIIRWANKGTAGIAAAIFLSPADSAGLQQRWVREVGAEEHSSVPVATADSALTLSMRAYGVPGINGYPIPISASALEATLEGGLVHIFSPPMRELHGLAIPALTYIGGCDTLQDRSVEAWGRAVLEWSALSSFVTIPSGDHQFHGHEDSLGRLIASWVLAVLGLSRDMEVFPPRAWVATPEGWHSYGD
jgi:pimeloyl-ACP methyl ester carboxylesterase